MRAVNFILFFNTLIFFRNAVHGSDEGLFGPPGSTPRRRRVSGRRQGSSNSNRPDAGTQHTGIPIAHLLQMDDLSNQVHALIITGPNNDDGHGGADMGNLALHIRADDGLLRFNRRSASEEHAQDHTASFTNRHGHFGIPLSQGITPNDIYGAHMLHQWMAQNHDDTASSGSSASSSTVRPLDTPRPRRASRPDQLAIFQELQRTHNQNDDDDNADTPRAGRRLREEQRARREASQRMREQNDDRQTAETPRARQRVRANPHALHEALQRMHDENVDRENAGQQHVTHSSSAVQGRGVDHDAMMTAFDMRWHGPINEHAIRSRGGQPTRAEPAEWEGIDNVGQYLVGQIVGIHDPETDRRRIRIVDRDVDGHPIGIRPLDADERLLYRRIKARNPTNPRDYRIPEIIFEPGCVALREAVPPAQGYKQVAAYHDPTKMVSIRGPTTGYLFHPRDGDTLMGPVVRRQSRTPRVVRNEEIAKGWRSRWLVLALLPQNQEELAQEHPNYEWHS